MKKYKFTFLLLLACIFFISCKKYFVLQCEEPIQVEDATLTIGFLHNNGTYLHSEFSPQFSKDSLKIKDENGTFLYTDSRLNLIPNTNQKYWEFGVRQIYNPNTDASSFDNTICKKFIIIYKHNSTDTITTCFKASKTECGSIFSNLKVYHKGNLINEVNDGIGVSCLIIKN